MGKNKQIKDSPKYELMDNGEYVNPTESDFKVITEPIPNAVRYIEEIYPETAKEFKRLQREQYKLFCKKQMDYGPSNIAMGTSLDTDEEKRLSKIGLIVRINDKIQRLINLVVKNNRQAQNEPTIDAFKDLSVYGIIAQIVDAGKWGK